MSSSTEKDGSLTFPGAGHINETMIHSFSMETIAPLSCSHLLSDESVEDLHLHRDFTGRDLRQDSPPSTSMAVENCEAVSNNEDDEMITDGDESGNDICLHHPEVAAFHRDHAGFIISPRKRQILSHGDRSRLDNNSTIPAVTATTLSTLFSTNERSFAHGMVELTNDICNSATGSSTLPEGPVALAPRFSEPLLHQGPTTPQEWNRCFLSSRSMSGDDGTVEAGSPTSATARSFLREIPCPSIPIEAMESNCSAPSSFLVEGEGEEGGGYDSVYYGQDSCGTAAFPSSTQTSSSFSQSTEKPFLCRSLAWSQDSLDERRTSKRARRDGLIDHRSVGPPPQFLDSTLMSSSIASTWNPMIYHDTYLGGGTSLEERREEPSPLLVHWEEKLVDSKHNARMNKSTPTTLYYHTGSSPTAATSTSSDKYVSKVPPPIMAAASASQYSFDSC
jgi:hypothetical protein